MNMRVVLAVAACIASVAAFGTLPKHCSHVPEECEQCKLCVGRGEDFHSIDECAECEGCKQYIDCLPDCHNGPEECGQCAICAHCFLPHAPEEMCHEGGPCQDCVDHCLEWGHCMPACKDAPDCSACIPCLECMGSDHPDCAECRTHCDVCTPFAHCISPFYLEEASQSCLDNPDFLDKYYDAAGTLLVDSYSCEDWAGDCEEHNQIQSCEGMPAGVDDVQCEIGGWGPDAYGYFYSAAKMAKIRKNCPASCQTCDREQRCLNVRDNCMGHEVCKMVFDKVNMCGGDDAAAEMCAAEILTPLYEDADIVFNMMVDFSCHCADEQEPANCDLGTGLYGRRKLSEKPDMSKIVKAIKKAKK